MTTMRISDQDLEHLVHGENPESRELARLAEALQKWQADFARTPTEDQIAAFASQAAEIAKQGKPTVTPLATTTPRRSRFRALKYKLATGMAAVLMLSGMTGVAVASDEAAPGDALYGIDRALENIGINDGGAAERIAEAQSLFDAGLVGEALEHSAEAFEDDETATEAVNALMEAAARVAESGNAEGTLEGVSDLLEAMAEADKGQTFGELVSDMARDIKGVAPDDAGPQPELPGQSSGDPQGTNSENSGEPGRGNQGNQENQGNPGNQGPPDEPPGQAGDKAGRP
jgi:hypothetical protein